MSDESLDAYAKEELREACKESGDAHEDKPEEDVDSDGDGTDAEEEMLRLLAKPSAPASAEAAPSKSLPEDDIIKKLGVANINSLDSQRVKEMVLQMIKDVDPTDCKIHDENKQKNTSTPDPVAEAQKRDEEFVEMMMEKQDCPKRRRMPVPPPPSVISP